MKYLSYYNGLPINNSDGWFEGYCSSLFSTVSQSLETTTRVFPRAEADRTLCNRIMQSDLQREKHTNFSCNLSQYALCTQTWFLQQRLSGKGRLFANLTLLSSVLGSFLRLCEHLCRRPFCSVLPAGCMSQEHTIQTNC